METNLSQLFATNIKIFEGDPLSEFVTWPHNVEVCITRIPVRKRDGWDADKFKQLAIKLKGHMAPNGIVFLVCYAPQEDKARPFEVARTMQDAGFTHIDNIVMQKSWLPGKRSESNLVNSHEFILYFCNGKVWSLDRLPLKEYMGSSEAVSCPGNTWTIETGSLDEAYPLDLAELLVRMTDCLPGSVIFDPYMGTHSALAASLRLGHSFYGFEQQQRRLRRYKKLIDKYQKEGKI